MRAQLSYDRVIAAAVRVADAGGLTQVSMRNIGRELGVEAMSLYHHVPNKSAVLDGLADWYFTQIELPDLDAPWRPAMVARSTSARLTLAAHPWALGLVESRRTPGPAVLRQHDSVLGCLRRNGFPLQLAARAFSAIDAYVYGFVLTELNLPFEPEAGPGDFVNEFAAALRGYPYLAEMVDHMVTGERYRYADEFLPGLDLILDSIEQRLTALPDDHERTARQPR